MPRQYVAAAQKRLATGITSTDTTITLQDINGRDGTALTMTDFGDIGYAAIDPNTDTMELISFTGISSTQLTGVTRGLSFKQPYTAVVALRLAHAGNAVVIFTNTPQFYNDFVDTRNAETITGLYTFSNTVNPRLDTYVAPTVNEQFAPKKYVDDITLAGAPDASTTVKGISEEATAAEAAAGTAIGGTSARLFLPSAIANSVSSANTLVPITEPDGDIDVGFMELDAVWAFTGNNTHAGTETFSNTTNITPATSFQLGGVAFTGSMANLNESSTFFGATDITGTEAEDLSDGGITSIHNHTHEGYQRLLGRRAVDFRNCRFTSTTDGSIIIAIYSQNIAGSAKATFLIRYQRDPVTSVFYATHSTGGSTIANATTIMSEPTIVGSFVYQVYESSTGVVGVTRYALADLSGSTAITISGGTLVASSNYNAVFTDGTEIFIQRNPAGGTPEDYNRYTISGTTITFVAIRTFTSIIGGGALAVHVSDNTNLWSFNSTSQLVRSTLSTGGTDSTFTYGGATAAPNFGFGAGIGVVFVDSTAGLAILGTNRLYLGQVESIFTATSENGLDVAIFPIQKT